MGDLLLRRLAGHAIEKPRVDQPSLALIGDGRDHETRRILRGRADHRSVSELVFVREVEIALIVRRTAEDRARAVFHQNKICDEHRELPVRVEGMVRIHPGIEALLLCGLDQLLRCAVPLALGDEGRKLGVLCRGRRRERVIGRKRHEFRAEQRVVARRENFELVFPVRGGRGIKCETHQEAL